MELLRFGERPHLAARLRRGAPPAGSRTWIGHHGFIRHSRGPGWALVGDAGYFKDPISAQGLSDAMRDAELVARAAVDGLDDANLALDDALAHYESTRDRLSIALFDGSTASPASSGTMPRSPTACPG